MYTQYKRPPLFEAVAVALIALIFMMSFNARANSDAYATSAAHLEQQLVSMQSTLALLAAANADLVEDITRLEHAVAQLQAEVGHLVKPPNITPAKRTAYLTFDDGPSRNTGAILDILKTYGVQGTFFVTGNNTNFGREMYKRIVNEGHALGNHTYSHHYASIYTTPQAYWQEHMRLEELLYEVVNLRPDILRFPGGSNNTVSHRYGGENIMDELTSLVLEKGYSYIDWNVTSQDATVPVQEVEVIVEAVLKGVQQVSHPIVLFHDSSQKTTTVEALPVIIARMLEQGFTFDILSASSYVVRFK